LDPDPKRIRNYPAGLADKVDPSRCDSITMRVSTAVWEDSEMKNMAWVAGLAAAIIGSSAAVAAPVANADPTDDAYLHALTQGGLSWDAGSEQKMISVGHAVCTDWSGGNTLAQTVADVKNSLGLSDGGTGTLLGATTASYCPQYQSKLS
jgi:hypothetical protein